MPASSIALLDSVGVVSTGSTGGARSTTLLVDSVGIPLVIPGPAIPNAPYGLTTTTGDTTAIISWTPPDHSRVDYYLVTTSIDAFTDYFQDTYSASSTIQVSSSITSVLLSGLINGSTYTVTVTAVNASGSSVPSAPVMVTPILNAPVLTDPNAPPPPPPTIDPKLLPPSPEYAPEMDADTLAFPIHGVRQAVSDVTGRPVVPPWKVGHLQSCWLEKLDNGQILYLLPSRGGLWITGFDPGYPTVQAVTVAYPDRDGELDYTSRCGPRSTIINLLAEPWQGIDINGVLQPTQAWVELVRAWSSLDNRLRIHYQLTGQRPATPMCAPTSTTARSPSPTSAGSPCRSPGACTAPTGWSTARCSTDTPKTRPARGGTNSWSVRRPPSGGFNFLGGSTWAGGSGQDFNAGSTWTGGDGLHFGGGSSYGGPIINVAAETIGNRRSQPVIYHLRRGLHRAAGSASTAITASPCGPPSSSPADWSCPRRTRC